MHLLRWLLVLMVLFSCSGIALSYAESLSVPELERKIAVNPEDADSLFALAKIYASEKKDVSKGIYYLEKVIKLKAREETYLNMIADLYCVDGQFEKAAETLQRLDNINPNRKKLPIEPSLNKMLSIMGGKSESVRVLIELPFTRQWRFHYTGIARYDAPGLSGKDLEDMKYLFTSMVDSLYSQIITFSQQGNIIEAVKSNGAEGMGVMKDKWFVVFFPPFAFGKGNKQMLLWGEMAGSHLVGKELHKVFSENNDPRSNYEVELYFKAELGEKS